MHKSEANVWSALLLEIADATELAVRDAVELSSRELAALVLVGNRPDCTVGWLHRRLGLTQSGAVRLLDRLQQLSLVSRSREPGRRQVALRVTERGEEVLARGTAARTRAIGDEFAGVAAADLHALSAVVRSVVAGRTRSRDEGDEACRLCDWRACTAACPMERSVRADPTVDVPAGPTG